MVRPGTCEYNKDRHVALGHNSHPAVDLSFLTCSVLKRDAGTCCLWPASSNGRSATSHTRPIPTYCRPHNQHPQLPQPVQYRPQPRSSSALRFTVPVFCPPISVLQQYAPPPAASAHQLPSSVISCWPAAATALCCRCYPVLCKCCHPYSHTMQALTAGLPPLLRSHDCTAARGAKRCYAPLERLPLLAGLSTALQYHRVANYAGGIELLLAVTMLMLRRAGTRPCSPFHLNNAPVPRPHSPAPSLRPPISGPKPPPYTCSPGDLRQPATRAPLYCKHAALCGL
jgi:hypothetical protein